MTPNSIAVMSCLAWILGVCVGMLHSSLSQSRSRDVQRSVRYASRLLRYTPRAAQQCARHGVSTEWVETAILFPTDSGSLRRAPVAWFVREFGNKRIQVRATATEGGRIPVVTNIEVTAVNGPT